MKPTPEVEFTRPTLFQLRKSLPEIRRHHYLRLMPYSFGAGWDYAELQVLVHHSLANPDPELRVAALEKLASLFDTDLGEIQNRERLVVEVATLVRQRSFSCLAAETELVARLGEAEIVIEERKLLGTTVGVPELVGQVRWREGRLSAGRGDALLPLEEAVAALTAMPPEQLAAMPVRERKSAIRLIRLFAMYGPPVPGADPAVSRHMFLRQLGLPVWRTLLSHGFAPEDAEPGIYAQPAMRRLQMAVEEAIRHPEPEEGRPSARLPDKPAPRTPADPASPEASIAGVAMHTFISGPIPMPRDEDHKALIKPYQALCKPMPVAKLPRPAELDSMLVEMKKEFPWAQEALHAIFDDLRTRSTFGGVRTGFTPTLLSGPGGCGKSRLAQRLAHALGIECFTMSLAGSSDSVAIVGTARGWSSGQPSPLLRPVLKGCASVLICMDEIDKATDGTRNSPPATSALLSFLEPEEAKRWRDNFLQVEVDLTPLLWIFTSNSTTNLSAPLRSRLRILEIEQPNRAQMLQVVPFVIRDVEKEWGLPRGALDGFEIAPRALRYVATMRGLRRAIAIAARKWLDGLNPIRH